ncbi:MAG: peptide MFS transporter [Pirellulales bacterium]|nr:peptide MFS transporter [Pirellulales bacterium]
MSQAANGASSGTQKAARKKHPRGLWVLFIAEMWERYAFYTMQGILVLYLIERTTSGFPPGPGFGWDKPDANKFCGWFMGLTYLTPIFGGWLADKLLGTHRSLVLGGIIIAIGQFFMAGAEFFGFGDLGIVNWTSAPVVFSMFAGGLLLVIIGCGFFKPCAAVMVGQLYSLDDPRRDSAYTIFYMGINVGAFIAPLVAGVLYKNIGWHWAFASGGVGMLLGLTVYQVLRPFYLKGIGLPPHHRPEHEEDHKPTPEQIKQAEIDEHERTRPLTRVDWDRIIVILVLTMFAGVYWVAMKQQATSLTVFAEESTNRTIPALKTVLPETWYQQMNPFPTPWYQSVNPLAIILFAPVFAWLWGWLDRRKMQPSLPVKFGIGVLLVGIAYIAMIFGAIQAARQGLAGPEWLMIMYLIGTWGELCVSPVGLSMVTKLSPVRCQSMMMGLYFGILFFANTGAGYVAAFGDSIAARGVDAKSLLPGQGDFFLILTVVPILVGVLVLVLSPKIKRMMHGMR